MLLQYASSGRRTVNYVLTIARTQYTGSSYPYCSVSYPATNVLTPISLPDGSFTNTGPNPVLSHRSQEYQYGVGSSFTTQGLGITAPFPSDYPTDTPGPDLHQDEIKYDIGDITQPSPASITHRTPRRTPPTRESPVSILPHPEGVQRLEQERLRSQYEIQQQQQQQQQQQKRRTPGRRRADPQAVEEDIFVEALREENVSWRVIRERFFERFDKDIPEACLQMRMTRRRKGREARWDEDDVNLLIEARDYLEREKYQMIAQKVQDLGARNSYTAEDCQFKLQCLDMSHTHERRGRRRKTEQQHRRTRAQTVFAR